MTDTFVPEHGRRTTLRDVAREAGVSIKTVSRVVNKEPLVNEATALSEHVIGINDLYPDIEPF